ncbi:MAG TPA: 50S ribosomal protein L25 [Candidatus Limnocylindrales bacterium]|nr:50S ribosomal protein L25 [Candidatus Limnocylindrales bacterium]
MPTARQTLAAEPRETTGKAVAKLRRDGKIPAVVYGHGVDSSNVTVDAHEFELLRKHLGANALVDLSVAGDKSSPVLVHDVQVHPVNRRPLHIDLFLVRMTEELTVEVPLHSIGESDAIRNLGGTLFRAIDEVRIRALPDHLPDRIEYSIESLNDFETAIHVRDLPIPADATLLTDPDELVARVFPPRVEEAVAAPAEAPEGEAAEGAPAAGAAPAEEGSAEE